MPTKLGLQVYVPSAHHIHTNVFMLPYLLSDYYMPGTVTGPSDATGN